MPSIRVSVPHQLSRDEALRRIQRYIAQAKGESEKVRELEESWSGYEGKFSASAMGYSASGSVAIGPSEVTVETALPLIASPFKGKIETAIRDALARLLA